MSNKKHRPMKAFGTCNCIRVATLDLVNDYLSLSCVWCPVIPYRLRIQGAAFGSCDDGHPVMLTCTPLAAVAAGPGTPP